MPKLNRPPSYRLHKARACAVVTIRGVPHYLGAFGSPESFRRYGEVLVATFGHLSTPPAKTSPEIQISVSELILRYWTEHADRFYRKNDKPTDRWYHVRLALRPVRALFGDTAALEFGPRKLKAVREAIIAEGVKKKSEGLNRKYVNDHVQIIRRMFSWAISEELVPSSVAAALDEVSGLTKEHDPRLKEDRKILPVPSEHIVAVLPFLASQIQTMVQLQTLAGLRPDEVTIMRPCDIQRAEEIWLYRPASHKLEFHDIERCTPLGPRAQLLLLPWLDRDSAAYLFNPREVLAAKRAEMSRGKHRPSNTMQTRVREHYDDESYCQTIERACKRAGVPKWTPNQLRHNAGTTISSRFDLEAARVVLGHRYESTTSIYAQRDLQKAIEITRQLG